MQKILNVGLIGCGHIAETYFRAHRYFNNFKIIKCADIIKPQKDVHKKYGIEFSSVNNLLEDNSIKVVLNAYYSYRPLSCCNKKLF